MNSPSANTWPADLESLSIYITRSTVAGRMMGLKFRESGLIGTIVIDYRLLYTIGPDRLIFLPREPKGVEIMMPSPHTLASSRKFLPYIRVQIFNLSTLFLISRCISSQHEKFFRAINFSSFSFLVLPKTSNLRVFIILRLFSLMPVTKLLRTLYTQQCEQLAMMGQSPSEMEMMGIVWFLLSSSRRARIIVQFQPIEIMQFTWVSWLQGLVFQKRSVSQENRVKFFYDFRHAIAYFARSIDCYFFVQAMMRMFMGGMGSSIMSQFDQEPIQQIEQVQQQNKLMAETSRQKQSTAILKNNKKLYIYAEVDIDKAYSQIISKSKKIQKFIQTQKLDFEFQEKIRNYKNFRICFDSEIQKFIHNKQLAADLRLIKKNVFAVLQDFIIERYTIFIEDEQMHREYKAKIDEVELKFMKRMEQLMRTIQQ